MGTKEQFAREIERLPENLIEEVHDFIAFVQRRREPKSDGSWAQFSLGTGTFNFWNEPEEVEYSLDDLKKRA